MRGAERAESWYSRLRWLSTWKGGWILGFMSGVGFAIWGLIRQIDVYYIVVAFLVTVTATLWLVRGIINTWEERKNKTLRKDFEPLRNQLEVLYNATANSAYSKAYDLLGQIASKLKEMDKEMPKQLVGFLIDGNVMPIAKASQEMLEESLKSDVPRPDPRQLQIRFGGYYKDYQELVTWIKFGGKIIDFPFDSDDEYQWWRKEDEEFIRRLKDLIALPDFSQLCEIVEHIGWGEVVRTP